MSLKPQGINPVPEETARVARAAYPKGNVYMHMRDELGTIYEDESFADLFSPTGQPAEAPWRLALVTIMQFAEGLSDRQAADAVRGRIDVKYALSLDLSDPGFDASILSEFRARLIVGHAEEHLLTAMLRLFKERGWRNRTRQTTNGFHPCAGQDPSHQSTGVRRRNTASCGSPVWRWWLLGGCSSTVSRSGWIAMGFAWKTHGFPPEKKTVRPGPKASGKMEAKWRAALFEPNAPSWLREIPSVDILRRVWVQNYQWSDGKLSWRSPQDIPPAAQYISSPYDLACFHQAVWNHPISFQWEPVEDDFPSERSFLTLLFNCKQAVSPKCGHEPFHVGIYTLW
jgi:transposase